MNRPMPQSFNENTSYDIHFTNKDPNTRDIIVEGSVGSNIRGLYLQPQFEIYDNEKGFIYYAVNYLCVGSIFMAIAMNSFLLELIRRRFMTLIKRPFFYILLVFCSINLISAGCSVVTEVPVVTWMSSFSEDNQTSEIANYTFTPIYQLFFNVKVITEQMVQYLNFLIALLRFCVFVMPSLEDKIFHNRNILNTLLFLSLLASSVLMIFCYTYSCYFRFEPLASFYTFDCYNLNFSDASPILNWYWFTLLWLPFIDFILYLMILLKFIFVRKMARSRKMEVVVFLQSLILFVSFEISALITIYLLNLLEYEKSRVYVTRRVVDTTYMLAAGLSPLFVLLTNTELKKSLTLTRSMTMTRQTRPESSRVSSNPSATIPL